MAPARHVPGNNINAQNASCNRPGGPGKRFEYSNTPEGSIEASDCAFGAITNAKNLEMYWKCIVLLIRKRLSAYFLERASDCAFGAITNAKIPRPRRQR
jgi:hypothetical protein